MPNICDDCGSAFYWPPVILAALLLAAYLATTRSRWAFLIALASIPVATWYMNDTDTALASLLGLLGGILLRLLVLARLQRRARTGGAV